MNLWEALLLGIIQGVTEFVPISSTAHVTLAGMLMGLQPQAAAQRWTAFLAVIQLGSLAAVLWYFRRELRDMVASLTGKAPHNGYRRLLLAVIVGTLPLGVLGLVLKPVVEGPLTKEPLLIATTLAAVSLLMVAAETVGRPSRTLMELNPWRDALLIGLAQTLALLPGSSRSGTTIAVAMLLGIARPDAARFSFLLSIPAIAASGIWELKELAGQPLSAWGPLGVSLVAAVLSSYAAIALLLRYLRVHTLWVFIVYRLALAVLLGFVAVA
jgi:undecaprenyl-diphosphatase